MDNRIVGYVCMVVLHLQVVDHIGANRNYRPYLTPKILIILYPHLPGGFFPSDGVYWSLIDFPSTYDTFRWGIVTADHRKHPIHLYDCKSQCKCKLFAYCGRFMPFVGDTSVATPISFKQYFKLFLWKSKKLQRNLLVV